MACSLTPLKEMLVLALLLVLAPLLLPHQHQPALRGL
jgi:hypothetical protein